MAALGSAPFLYPIIDTGVCDARSVHPVELAGSYLAAGVRMVQVRDKRASSAELLSLADAIVREAHACGARAIVNDRADIALLSGADGVHVGQDDLSVADVRRVIPGEVIVGLSTHDVAQVDDALRTTATYIAVGPIFGTATKDTGYSARGLDLVRYAAGRGKPVVAIGGITLENVRRVIDAGASGAAVITDLLHGDPAARAREFLRAIGAAGRPADV